MIAASIPCVPCNEPNCRLTLASALSWQNIPITLIDSRTLSETHEGEWLSSNKVGLARQTKRTIEKILGLPGVACLPSVEADFVSAEAAV
jgi:hypothetical protein